MPPQQNINVTINANASGLLTTLNTAVRGFKSFSSAVTGAVKPLQMLGAVGQAALGTFGRMSRLGVGSLNTLGGAVSRVNGFFANHTKVLQQSATSYKGLVGQVVSLNRFINVLGSSIRQIGQGLQNFGIVFSLYVSAPISGFIYNMTKSLIDFQDALIEVRRTTGLSNVELGKLSEYIQQIALVTPTSRLELAEMAAAWGRLGITGPETIAKLVQASDKLRISTTLTAEQVVDDLGKIGAIFFESSVDFADQYDNIASAINELGQASAVNESEIVAAFLRVAPVGAQLDIPIADLLAISTTAAERAASPERAGTQLARALTEQASKLKTFADVLGITREEVQAMIDADAIEFFLNVAEAIGKIDSASQRVAIGEELFGGVGSKAANALAANLPGLYENLVLANEAFDDGTSIQKEYERSLDSVKVQLGILRNNFEYLGASIGEVVLPYITKFASAAIPALQMAAESFKGLNDRVKVSVIAFGALLAVLGPILLFVGSLLFSIGIITTGFTALFTQVIGVGVGLGKLAFTILGLLAPVSLLRVGILGIGATLLYVYGVIGDATGKFAEFVTSVYNWGFELINAYAGGILAGAQTIQSAILTVIDSFVGFIMAFSPPREGPLRNITQWGRSTMEAYGNGIEEASESVRSKLNKSVEGMVGGAGFRSGLGVAFQAGQKMGLNVTMGVKEGIEEIPTAVKGIGEMVADALEETNEYIITIGAKFSSSFADAIRGLSDTGIGGFQDVFGAVRGFIEASGANLGLDRDIIDQNVLKGADAVLDLINRLESGGGAGGALSGISDMLNGLGGDIERMAEAQYEYNRATEELDRIKSDSEDLSDALKNEIALIAARNDLTLDQKSALIRAAKLRQDDRKKQLDEEKEAAEDRVKELEKEAKRRRGILDILRELIFPAEKEKIKDDKDPQLDINGGFDPDAYTRGIEEAKKKVEGLFSDTGEKLDTFFTKIDRAREVWRGFIAGITGDFDIAQLDREGETFWEGFIPGNNIRVAYEEITGVFNNAKDAIDGMGKSIQNLGRILGAGTVSAYLKLDSQVLDDWSLLEKIVYNIGRFFGSISSSITDFYNEIEPQRKGIADTFKRADEGGQASENYVTGFIQNLDFNELGRNIAEMLNIAIGEYLSPSSEAFQTLGETVAAFFGGTIEFIASFLSTADLSGLTTGLTAIINTMVAALTPQNLNPTTLENAAKNIVQAIVDFVAAFDISGGAETNVLSGLVSSILRGIASVDLSQFSLTLQRTVGAIVWGLATVDWNAFFTIFNKISGTIIEILSDPLLWTGVVVLVGNIVNAMIEAFPTFQDALITGIEDVFKGIGPAIAKALWESILSALFGSKQSIQEFDGNIWKWTANQMSNPGEGGFPVIDYFTGGTPDALSEDNKKADDQLANVPVTTSSGNNDPWSWLPWRKEDAKNAGKAMGQEVTTGVGEHITSPETAQTSSMDVKTFADAVNTQSEPTMWEMGTDFSKYVTGGMAEEFDGPSTQAEFMALSNALRYWGSTNSMALNSTGQDYAASIITGIITELGDADTYMSWLITGGRTWVNDSENKRRTMSIGFSWGVTLVEGLVTAIVMSEPYIWSAIDKVLTRSTLPLAPNNIVDPFASATPASVGVMYDDNQASAQSAGNVYVTINSTQPVTEAEAKRLSQRIQNEMLKQARIRSR